MGSGNSKNKKIKKHESPEDIENKIFCPICEPDLSGDKVVYCQKHKCPLCDKNRYECIFHKVYLQDIKYENTTPPTVTPKSEVIEPDKGIQKFINS